MQRVSIIVLRQVIFVAVQGEPAFRNAVAVAAHQRSEERLLAQVTIEVIEAQHQVREFSVTVGRLERHHGAAVIRNGNHHAVGIG